MNAIRGHFGQPPTIGTTARSYRAIIDSYVNYRRFKRTIIFLIGGFITLLGVMLLVLPGPAVILIPVGLAILGAEFAWARRLLRRFRDAIR